MSRPTGRHRVRRETGLRALRRPAVAATAAISAVSVSAAGYATASSAVASSSAGATMQTGEQASSAALGAANAAVVADASAQLTAKNAAVAARAAATGRSKSQLAKQRAHSAALRTKAEKAASAKHSSVARAKAAAAAKAKAAAAAKAKAAAAAKAKAEAEAKRNRDTRSVSRSSERPPATQTPTYSGSPQAIASSMLASYGWGQDQMGCLTALWNKESGWNVYANNPSSGAYGIPQSLPGSKMASAGADWRTNPATQIRWGLGYIRSSYGSPCGAWGHSQATNWY